GDPAAIPHERTQACSSHFSLSSSGCARLEFAVAAAPFRFSPELFRGQPATSPTVRAVAIKSRARRHGFMGTSDEHDGPGGVHDVSMPSECPVGDDGDTVVAVAGFTASTASARPGDGDDVPTDAAPGLTASMASARTAAR
ncbi:hypothetical protein EJB05_17693, partial [Eragrostis curvula]